MKKTLKDILLTSFYLLLVLVMVLLVITYVGQKIEVVGPSMSPTLTDGDNMFIDKISYRFSDPERFDIVVFPYQHEKDTYFIKRIIGLPGETVFIDNAGTIYINGEILDEGYGAETIQNPGRAYEPVTLGPDEYFVLGDNRNNSSDSRDPNVGNLKRSRIIGKAFMRVSPFRRMGMIKHK
ncbi:MAG: signal peptidase I [Lachnospiraceae bacterium]|nr:signal peptidase I [Lachnospiraceae bacterium]